MNEVTIFSSSNREDNRSIVFAEYCRNLLEDQGIKCQICNLQQLPLSISGADMYDFKNSPLGEIVEKYLTSVNKLIFVIPEYNGSFPGILKLFIDSIDPSHFQNKKAALIGISSGRSGNIRGMDHLTNILNYLKVDVHHYKVAVSSINNMIEEGKINDVSVNKRIALMLESFLKF